MPCMSLVNMNKGIGTTAHAGSRTRVTSMGGLYDAATLHALLVLELRANDGMQLHLTLCMHNIAKHART